MDKESFELIEGLIQDEIIELGLLARDHRNLLRDWFFERIRKYADAQAQLKELIKE